MIQVIPFTGEPEPPYLALLARGLSDLCVLRLNAVQIEAQINLGLKFGFGEWQSEAAGPNPVRLEEAGELWLAGMLKFEPSLSMEWVLYDPVKGQIVYADRFAAAEEKFMGEWARHFQALVAQFQTPEVVTLEQLATTRSLPAFLEFRKGLELLSQAKTSRMKVQGLENLLTAVAYDADFVEAVDILLLFVLQNNQPEELEYFLKLLERLRQIVSHYPRVPLVMAELYAQMQNSGKTEQLLGETVAAFPEFSEAWVRLALHYHSNQRPAEALTTLQQLLEREADNLVALDLMGAIYAGMGERTLAKQVWLKVLQSDATRVNVLNNLGLLAEEDNDPQQAEHYYKQAILVNNQWWGSFYNFGSFCRRQGRLEEAAAWLEKAGKLNGGQFQIFYFWGMTLFDLERYSEAQEVLIHLLKVAPDNAIRQQGLATLDRFSQPEVRMGLKLRQVERLWERGGKPAAVVAMLCQIGPRAWKNWFYWYLWGRVAAGFKNDWLTRVFWEHGLKLEPGFGLLKSLAFYYWEKKRFKKALPLFKQAYQLHHNDHELLQAYLHTLINLGAQAQAEIEEFLADQGQLTANLLE